MPGLKSTNASRRLEYLSRVSVLAIAVLLSSGCVLWAQTPDSKTDDSNKSWSTTTEAQGEGVNPTRTTESHTQSGNRTVDKQSVERRGPDGHFEPFQDIETETVKVDAHTVRTITRAFARNSEGAKTLVQVTEEETRSSATGDSNMVRTVSSPDVNGKLQLVQRQIGETKQLGKGVEETKTTVMLPSINGGLAPAMKTQERRTAGANDTVESQKTTLLPDGSGNFQVSEVRQATIKQDGKNSSSDERVSRPGSDGKFGEISRPVTRDSEGTSGEKRILSKPILSMFRVRPAMAACTWWRGRLPRSAQVQRDSRRPNSRLNARTQAIQAPTCR